jgi:hypothetical protein
MVFRTTWLEFKDMAQDLLVRKELVAASCNRRPHEGLETQKYSLYPKGHPASCTLRWRLSNGLGCISHDCKLEIITIQGNLTGDQYIRDVLQPVVVPNFDNHTLATMPVYMDDNAQASSFNSCNRLPPKRNRDLRSLASHEPGFESHRTYLGHVRSSNTDSVASCQLEAELHLEWQKLSQQDIRRLTGGMRRRVEAVIQANGGYTRY